MASRKSDDDFESYDLLTQNDMTLKGHKINKKGLKQTFSEYRKHKPMRNIVKQKTDVNYVEPSADEKRGSSQLPSSYPHQTNEGIEKTIDLEPKVNPPSNLTSSVDQRHKKLIAQSKKRDQQIE